MRWNQPPNRGVAGLDAVRKGRDAMGEGQGAPPDDNADGIPLIEGWMLGKLFFPLAMDEIQRVPAANDDEA